METKRQQWIKFKSLIPIVEPTIAIVSKVAEKCNHAIQKVSTIVFMDTPPIVLKKHKQIPTPPNSPRIQQIEDEMEMQHNGKKNKTNKGYKDKTKSSQKRKATENYKQEQIAKERKNAEKTKEKMNRRQTIVI